MARFILRKAIRRYLLSTFKLAILFLCFLQTAFGDVILDPKANHPLLRKIADKLDRQGIDVIQNYLSGVETQGRPVLAPLANFPVTSYEISDWQEELDQGVTNALVAAPGKSPNVPFRTKWDNAGKERVFISFAREDGAIAEKIAATLEEEGYVVFTYIRNGKAVLSTKAIAHYMATASTHFVIDTKTARSKEGVMAEALVHAKYWSSDLLKENIDLENQALERAKNKNINAPSYDDLFKRYKKYYSARNNLDDEGIKKEMEQQGITKDNVGDFMAKLVDEESIRIAENINYNKTNATPYQYNGFLKEFIASFFEGSPYICSICHLPLSFPVCLPLLVPIE